MNILIINADAHTFASTYYSLRKEFDCNIYSTSTNPESASQYITDGHFHMDFESETERITHILDICKQNNIDIIVPQSTKDRIMLMNAKNLFAEQHIHIISVEPEVIKLANDKLAFTKLCEEHNIPLPKYHIAKTYDELKQAAKDLGYPKKKVIVKPVVGSGSRGFRILNRNVDYKKTFYASRPDQLIETKLGSLKPILGESFYEPLIVSEYIPGEEYTVDCLKFTDQEIIIPRKRVQTKNGLTNVGKIEKHQEIIDLTRKLIHILNITSVFGFQFKLDANGTPLILECNPRIQGTMVMSTLAGANIIAESIKRARGLPPSPMDIDWEMTFHRYNSGFSIGKTIQMMNITKKEITHE